MQEQAMPDPINRVQLFSILKENQRKTGNPMGVSPEALAEWSKDEKFVELMFKEERSGGFSLALKVLGSETASSLAGRLVKEEENKVERARRILRNASRLLSNNGIEHTYLGLDEPYSGILFYDLGLVD